MFACKAYSTGGQECADVMQRPLDSLGPLRYQGPHADQLGQTSQIHQVCAPSREEAPLRVKMHSLSIPTAVCF